jgi:hypothetical protein
MQRIIDAGDNQDEDAEGLSSIEEIRPEPQKPQSIP